MQAAVMIHRMLWWKKVCYPCAAMQAAGDSQNALVQEGVLSLRCPCKLAAVMIHRMLWWKKGVLSLRFAMQAAAVVIHRMLWWKKGCVCTIPALSCSSLLS
jgi:hypothetical protein